MQNRLVLENVSSIFRLKMPVFSMFVFKLCSTLINSQTIVLENMHIASPCNNSMRSTADYFTITGKVGPDFNHLLGLDWSDSITIEQHPKAELGFRDFCTISIGQNGERCRAYSAYGCYCNDFDATTGYARFIINVTAKVDLSEAQFRAKWLNKYNNGHFLYSANTVNVPKTLDEENVTLKLKVNGKEVVRTPTGCIGTFFMTDVSTVELCCYNTASPCFVQMISPAFVVRNQSMCATYSSLQCRTHLIPVNMSYSVCSRTNFKGFLICVINVLCLSDKNEDNLNTTPENERIQKSPYVLLTGMLWCLLLLMCLCGCQAGVSKYSKGVWCHYVNCYEEEETADNKFGDDDSSVASMGRKANTETDDETATVTTSKAENKIVSFLHLPDNDTKLDDVSSITSIDA